MYNPSRKGFKYSGGLDIQNKTKTANPLCRGFAVLINRVPVYRSASYGPAFG